MNPKFLYHGSPHHFEILVPQQAKGANEKESKFAIYACEHFHQVIPFALPIRWYPDKPSGKRDYSCDWNTGRTVIKYGSIDPDGFGYVYKFSSDGFEKIDDFQWTSCNEVVPIKVTRIAVNDYWHTIKFSNEALEINKLLYPSDTLYSIPPSQTVENKAEPTIQ